MCDRRLAVSIIRSSMYYPVLLKYHDSYTANLLDYILHPTSAVSNDDFNLIFLDNFLGSADYSVPTSVSRLPPAQSITSSRLRANISLLTLD